MTEPVTTPEQRSGSALRRDRANGVAGGVCAGIAKQLGIDVRVVRIAFVAITFAGGLGIALYAMLCALVPEEGRPGRSLTLPQLQGRGGIEVALGAGLLLLSALVTLRALGLWWSDIVVWPIVLAVAGGVLLRREAGTLDDVEPAEEVYAEKPAIPAACIGLVV